MNNFLNQPRNIKADASFLGIGFNSSYRKAGVEQAPNRIRQISFRYSNADGSSQPLKIYNPTRGYLLEGVTISDNGNVKLPKGISLKSLERMVQHKIGEILDSGNLPLVSGGDHYITYPIISAFKQPLTVIQFDAHGDYLDESECLHGSVMRYVRNLPNVKRVIHCGLRGNLNTGPGLADSLRQGNIIISAEELNRRGARALVEKLKPEEPTYITFDTDFLDPSIAAATGFPEPEGINYNLAREVIEKATKKTTVKGIDFTEYNPVLDCNNITGIHLTNLMLEFLSTRFRKHNQGGKTNV